MMEFESNKSMWLSQGGLDDSNLFNEKFNQMIEVEVERRLEAEVEMRAEKEREERELMLLEKERELERLRVQHEREMYLIKKKLSVAGTSVTPSTPRPQPLHPEVPDGRGRENFIRGVRGLCEGAR